MVLFYKLMGPPSYMRSVDRNVAMRRMTVHDHNTENNDISIQFLYFTSRNTQYCNNTLKGTVTVQISCKLQQTTPFTLRPIHRGDRSIYHVPRMPPAVTAADRWAASTDRQRFSNVIYYTWAAAGGCETFLRTVMCSTFCKVRSQAPGTAAVFEGQDSKTSVQNGNWYSRKAQRVRGTKVYITGTNNSATYILCEHCLVIHCYRTVIMIIHGW